MAMIQAMLDHQMEETRHLLQENGREPASPIVQLELEEEQSGEGNYSRTVSQVEPQVVRRNDLERGIDKDGCKYNPHISTLSIIM